MELKENLKAGSQTVSGKIFLMNRVHLSISLEQQKQVELRRNLSPRPVCRAYSVLYLKTKEK